MMSTIKDMKHVIQPWIILSSLVSTIIYLSGALANGAFDLKLWAESWRFGCGFAIATTWIIILVGVILWAVSEHIIKGGMEVQDED